MSNSAMEPEEALLVWTTVSDKPAAETLAVQLVESGLAACVHVFGQGKSFYRWQGEMQQESESTLLIKTLSSHYDALENLIKKIHPYDLPEILATPVVQGESAYLDWIGQSTRQNNQK
ncbi:MAG: divalent-cation tolerance protein CutA [Magnetococcales bacterium]|nr:divalent-cation tolerance protein CutA [Magnetococcales bacterium]